MKVHAGDPFIIESRFSTWTAHGRKAKSRLQARASLLSLCPLFPATWTAIWCWPFSLCLWRADGARPKAGRGWNGCLSMPVCVCQKACREGGRAGFGLSRARIGRVRFVYVAATGSVGAAAHGLSSLRFGIVPGMVACRTIGLRGAAPAIEALPRDP